MASKRRPFSLRHEGGQSLVIVALAMAGILAVAAFGIDVSQWYATRHQAQVAADSAALAGANCMAAGGTTTSCATTPGTYVSDNNMSSSNAQFNTPASGDITVTVTAKGSNFFASALGISPPTYTEKAIASWKPSIQKPCGTTTTNCDFMFAYNNDACSAGNALTVNVQGSVSVSGNIVTNGNLSGSQTGGASTGEINGSESYGYGCAGSPNSGKPWLNPPTMASGPVTWPIDYTPDFPACSGSACVNGYPAWCTVTHGTAGTWTPTLTSGNIYCDSGGGTPSTPSTWTTGNISTSGTGLYDTFVAASITYGGGNLYSCGYTTSGYASADCSAGAPATTFNYPIFYAVGADSSSPQGDAFYWSTSGNSQLYGDVFAPNGTAYLSLGGTPVLSSFIEADYINASLSGNPSGDGPELSGGDGGNIIAGTDSLTG